jgi:hypothetical protein
MAGNFLTRQLAPAYWFNSVGTAHRNIGDFPLYATNPMPIGSIKSRRAAQIVQAYTPSLFNKHLLNIDDHLLDDPVALYPEVNPILKK